MPHAAAESLLPDPHDLVVVEGPDAATFLQGQLSQDVAALGVGSWAWALLLAPDGKLDAVLRVHRPATDRFELVVDPGFGDVVRVRLARFLLRTEATVSVDAGRAGSGGSEADRIEAGIPRQGVDVSAGDLAASTGLVGVAVDFTKGCFVGQELVARMDSRGGSAPTRLVRLRGPGEVPPRDTAIAVDAEPVGKLTSSAASGDGWVGLAMVSRKLVGAEATIDHRVASVEEL